MLPYPVQVWSPVTSTISGNLKRPPSCDLCKHRSRLVVFSAYTVDGFSSYWVYNSGYRAPYNLISFLPFYPLAGHGFIHIPVSWSYVPGRPVVFCLEDVAFYHLKYSSALAHLINSNIADLKNVPTFWSINSRLENLPKAKKHNIQKKF